jgi:hypothetical protein
MGWSCWSCWSLLAVRTVPACILLLLKICNKPTNLPLKQPTKSTKPNHAALSNNWGALLGMESSTNKSSLTVASIKSNLLPADQSAVPIGGCRGHCGRLQLSVGAYAGIAVGGLFIMGLMGFVVARGLGANKGKDKDKDVQLAYMNELTEADIAYEQDGPPPGEVVAMPPVRQTRLLMWLGGLPEPDDMGDEREVGVLCGLAMRVRVCNGRNCLPAVIPPLSRT